MKSLYEIKQIQSSHFGKGTRDPYYYVLIFDGEGRFLVDFTTYTCKGKTILFLSPYQFFKWLDATPIGMDALIFHGDFYCIEYHKKEVACNGLLFNTIYQQPYIAVPDEIYAEIHSIIKRMDLYKEEQSSFDHSILKSYLQVILALSSKEKKRQLNTRVMDQAYFDNIVDFQNVLENHFLETKEVSFYASQYELSVHAFSKKIKHHFGKSPSILIQERIALEAKKMLHLTHKPIKEIAASLKFDDEFYFSRYFKKQVGVSPKQFRAQVGISIVAK